MVPTTLAQGSRLALVARTSFIATIVTACISVALLLTQADIYMLHHPPLQLGDLASAGLKAAATVGTVLGVLSMIVGFVLRRISKGLAQAEQKRERLPGVVGNIADTLQPAPEQIGRLQAGQGCAFPITLSVLGISIVVATITFAPAQQVALVFNNPLAPPSSTVSGPASPTPFAGRIVQASDGSGAAGMVTSGAVSAQINSLQSVDCLRESNDPLFYQVDIFGDLGGGANDEGLKLVIMTPSASGSPQYAYAGPGTYTGRVYSYLGYDQSAGWLNSAPGKPGEGTLVINANEHSGAFNMPLNYPDADFGTTGTVHVVGVWQTSGPCTVLPVVPSN